MIRQDLQTAGVNASELYDAGHVLSRHFRSPQQDRTVIPMAQPGAQIATVSHAAVTVSGGNAQGVQMAGQDDSLATGLLP